MQRIHVVSLGCFCGVKLSLQHMGLGHAHLPFDWMRTTSAGVAHFVRNRFQGYFSCKTQLNVPDSQLKMQRSEQHSFWHDDIFQEQDREKLERRIDRFQGLSTKSHDILFLRACSSTDELLDVEDLFMALQENFAGGSESGSLPHRVLLAVFVDGQKAFEGPILHKQLPGLIFYCIGPHEQNHARAYCEAIASAVTVTLAAIGDVNPDSGFAVETLDRHKATLPPKISIVPSGQFLNETIRYWDGGLNSGFDNLASFERPGPQPGGVGVKESRAVASEVSKHVDQLLAK